MAKDGNMKVDTSVSGEGKGAYGIAAALAETLEAAVFADSSAASKAYEMIESYAYTDSTKSELQMSHFTMRDAAGRLQKLSIPTITMMPLPLLHVTEATFDLDLYVNLHTASESTVSMQGTSQAESPALANTRNAIRDTIKTFKANKKVSAAEHGRRADRYRALRLELRDNLAADKRRKARADSLAPSTEGIIGSSFVIAQGKSEQENSTTTHITVNVKMEQTELPGGIKALLQAAANSLTMKPVEEK